MIQIRIEHRRLLLPIRHQGLATGAHSRDVLADVFAETIATAWTTSDTWLSLHESTLERMIVKYSEQISFQPLREMRHWFTYSSGAYIEPGYPPLYYARGKKGISPNKSAVCAIGEGVAGFLAQRLFHCEKLARPNHDYPDIVMEAGQTIYLVEAKATLGDGIEGVLDEALPRLAALAVSAKQMDKRPMIALLVGTTLTSETEYQCVLREIALEDSHSAA